MMQFKFIHCLSIFVLLFAFLIQSPQKAKASEFHKSQAEIEQFFDEFFSKEMSKKHVPGVGFILVKDGKRIISKGYGYANIDKKIGVDPEKTLFRVASLSKIYVLMAILKLQEEGKLSVHDEVSKYLAEDDPLIHRLKGIKIHHLLTHTEGFPSKDVGTFVLNADAIPPLHDTLIKDLRKPTIQPGTGIAYGGMGSVLAAHIIENITGKAFDVYVKEKILQPLSMNYSTFSQTIPKSLQHSLATTYLFEDNKFIETEFLYGSTPPSGGLSSTPAEVSNLLIALMKNGTFDGIEILKQETVQSMIQAQYRGHDNLAGVTYGFFEFFQNNKRALVRDGSGFGVTTRMLFIPEEQIGFVYFQNIRGDDLLNELTTTFFDYFFEKKAKKTGIPLTLEEAKKLEGTYRAIQQHQNIMKVGSFFSGMMIDITANHDGTLQLVVSGPGDTAGWGGFEKEATLTQIEPMLFQRSDMEGYVAFENLDGKLLMHTGNGYHTTYEKIPWYEKVISQLVFLTIFTILFVITLIYSIIHFIKRNKKFYAYMELPFLQLCGVISLLNLSFPFPIFQLCFINQIAGFPAVAFGLPKLVQILLYVPVITGILTMLLFGLYYQLYRNVSNKRKIGYFVILMGCLLFIPYCIYWRFFPGFA